MLLLVFYGRLSKNNRPLSRLSYVTVLFRSSAVFFLCTRCCVPESSMSSRLFFLNRCCAIGLALFVCSAPLLLGSCRQQIPLIEQKCGTCHSATIVYQARRTPEGWRQVIHGMKLRGLVITPAEEEEVYQILIRNFLRE